MMMTEERAREILGDVIQEDGTLREVRDERGRVTGLGVNWPGFGESGELDRRVVWIQDTDVSADQLEAIAFWMRRRGK